MTGTPRRPAACVQEQTTHHVMQRHTPARWWHNTGNMKNDGDRDDRHIDTPSTTYLYGGGHGFNGQVAIQNDARGTVQDVLISEQHTSSAARHKTPW